MFCSSYSNKAFSGVFFNSGTTSKILIIPVAATLTTAARLWTPIKAVECNNVKEVLKMMAMIKVIMSTPLLCSLVAEEYIFITELISVGAAHNVIEVWRIICIKYDKIMYKAGIWRFYSFLTSNQTVLLLVNDCEFLVVAPLAMWHWFCSWCWVRIWVYF